MRYKYHGEPLPPPLGPKVSGGRGTATEHDREHDQQVPRRDQGDNSLPSRGQGHGLERTKRVVGDDEQGGSAQALLPRQGGSSAGENPLRRGVPRSSGIDSKVFPRQLVDDMDEMDPQLGKFEEMIDHAQFALLAASEQRVRDQEFLNNLGKDEKVMSKEGEAREHDGDGQQHDDHGEQVLNLGRPGGTRAAEVQQAHRGRKQEGRLNKLVKRAQK